MSTNEPRLGSHSSNRPVGDCGSVLPQLRCMRSKRDNEADHAQCCSPMLRRKGLFGFMMRLGGTAAAEANPDDPGTAGALA